MRAAVYRRYGPPEVVHIEDVGKAVTRFRAGDEVFGSTGFRLGAHAEYLCVPETGMLAAKPANMPLDEAAAVMFGGIGAGGTLPMLGAMLRGVWTSWTGTGTWELQSGKWVFGGQEASLPGNMSGSQLKTYSNGHFLFVGQLKSASDSQGNTFGGGTYSLNGEDYTETLVYHSAPALVGKTLHFKLVVKGNTMTLTGPVTPEDQKTIGGTLTEVYVRKD